MNQAIKDRVYSQGNDRFCDYVSILSGMNTLESEFFHRLHDNQTDARIMADMGLSQKTFDKIEESVSKKLLWAVLYCVDFTMRNDK